MRWIDDAGVAGSGQGRGERGVAEWRDGVPLLICDSFKLRKLAWLGGFVQVIQPPYIVRADSLIFVGPPRCSRRGDLRETLVITSS